MLNVQLLSENQFYFNEKRFIGEDCDLVLRVAGNSDGQHLRVVRLEDNALVYKSFESDKFSRNFEIEGLSVDNYLTQACDNPVLKEGVNVSSVYEEGIENYFFKV